MRRRGNFVRFGEPGGPGAIAGASAMYLKPAPGEDALACYDPEVLLLKEFKTFISRGNVVDLAVGVIIGASFGKITSSLVNDIIMPPIGLVLGKVDFSNLYVDLSGHAYPNLAAAKAAGAPTVNYGVFLNTIIDFFIVAFAVFLLVQWASKLMPKPAPPTATKECPYCCESIAVKATRCPKCTSELAKA